MTLYYHYFFKALKFMASFLIGALLYLWMIIAIYPTIEKMEGMDELIKKMPEALNAIFNLNSGLSNISSFIAMEYYGMVFIILMLVFSIMMSHQLFGKPIASKSMANILNLPVKRSTLMLMIQWSIVMAHLLFGLLMTLGCTLMIYLIVEDSKDSTEQLLHLNMLGVILFTIFSLLSITCMLLVKDMKHGVLIVSTIALIMYGLNIASKLSENLEYLKYFSLFSLYDSSKISIGEADVLYSYSICGIIILVLLIINTYLFSRKNLFL